MGELCSFHLETNLTQDIDEVRTSQNQSEKLSSAITVRESNHDLMSNNLYEVFESNLDLYGNNPLSERIGQASINQNDYVSFKQTSNKKNKFFIEP